MQIKRGTPDGQGIPGRRRLFEDPTLFRSHQVAADCARGVVYQPGTVTVHQYLSMPSTALGRKRWNSVSSVQAA